MPPAAAEPELPAQGGRTPDVASSTREKLNAAWLLEADALRRVARLRMEPSRPNQLRAALLDVAVSHAKAAELINELKRELAARRERP